MNIDIRAMMAKTMRLIFMEHNKYASVSQKESDIVIEKLIQDYANAFALECLQQVRGGLNVTYHCYEDSTDIRNAEIDYKPLDTLIEKLKTK